ncbi:MAG: reprolysin-like metallopeptidase [Bacteroidota bacterium]
MKNSSLFLLFTLLFISFTHAQKWTKVDNSSFRSLAEQRQLMPEKYESYQLDFDHLKVMLKDAPHRFISEERGIEIEWPMPDGKNQKFTIKRSDVLHPELAAKFPEIKAFTGHSIEDPTAILKISMSHKGIEGMLLSSRHETVYLDRYLPKSKNNYILYKRSDYKRELPEGEGTCTVEVPNDGYKFQGFGRSYRFGDCQLRKYRMALACTGEYANFHGGNIPDVMAEFNASLIRVNGIYERDFTITMELIPNNDQLIYLNGNTDPYTNNEGGTMLGQNQSVIDNVIGTDNYDIGHVYSTGGGGIASLRSPCNANRKARGVTGLGNPTGDPFWVDYVAHEIGHQFGGNHTQNNPCNRAGNTSVEPGSASTIMGYAGICSPNVQNNSDDYFHAASIAEVANFVVAGNGGNCAEIIPLDNEAPEIVSITETNQVLPSQTPFYLTAEATDADGNMLTYCWEQMDVEPATMPPVPTNTVGPAFRSYDPVESPTRYFPTLTSILSGTNTNTWETLTSENRDMNFNLTVRDNNPLGGCTADEALVVTFTDNAGPFLVTSQNAFETWRAGEMISITWDVANTDMAPVSCANVDILLSLDGGQNFDIVLADDIANDGEQEISVPFELTDQGRIMVKCSDKTFFDINNEDINILAPFASEVSPSNVTLCPNNTATFTIDYTVFGPDPYPVTFALNGLPAGATFTFTPEQAFEDTEVILTIENLTNDLVGTYELEVVTQGDSEALRENITLVLETDQNQMVNYLSPVDGQIGVDTDAFLSWDQLNGVIQYEIEVSDNPSFQNSVFSGSTIDNFIFPTGLESMTVYYWRVRGISSCVDAEWIDMQSFQTRSFQCVNETNDQEFEITMSNNNVIESEIAITANGNVSLLEISVEIDHSWIGDLTATLQAPDGTQALLFDRPGVPNTNFGCDANDIVVTFSDNALNTATDFDNTCESLGIGIEGRFQPMEPFSVFANKEMSGTWILIVTDQFSGDGGSLISWTIENCETIFFEPGVILNNNMLSLVDTDRGTINNGLLEVQNSDPINTLFTLRSLPMFGEIQKMNVVTSEYEVLAIGDQFTQEDINMDNIRYLLSDLNATDDSFLFDTEDDQFRYTNNNAFTISMSISALSLSASITNQITCFGSSDGQIEAIASGGIADYTYSLNGGPFVEQNTFTNLSAGNYTITVRDANGSEVESDVLVIIEPPQITYVFFRGDNEITIQGDGGTGTLMYSLDGINYTTENTIQIFDGTPYRIHVKDENDCLSQSLEFVFYQIGGADVSYIDVDCKGNENGSILIESVEGGLAPYTYQLNDGTAIDQNSFEGLAPDTYKLTIADSDGNQFTFPDIIITEPEEELSITITVSGNTLTLMGSGGTPPYIYAINGVGFTDQNVFPDLPAGEYEGSILDANGCMVTETNIIISTSTLDPVLEDIVLYPNPTESNFILKSNVTIDISYEIRDINGQLIRRGQSFSNHPIQVEDFTSGLYLIKVTYRDSSKLFKMNKI